jgi:hypothetical protein
MGSATVLAMSGSGSSLKLYLGSPSLLQGEYDSPGDDMNDRKVSLLCAALSVLGRYDYGTGYQFSRCSSYLHIYISTVFSTPPCPWAFGNGHHQCCGTPETHTKHLEIYQQSPQSPYSTLQRKESTFLNVQMQNLRQEIE